MNKLSTYILCSALMSSALFGGGTTVYPTQHDVVADDIVQLLKDKAEAKRLRKAKKYLTNKQ